MVTTPTVNICQGRPENHNAGRYQPSQADARLHDNNHVSIDVDFQYCNHGKVLLMFCHRPFTDSVGDDVTNS